jgi:hypothetical protein
LACNQHSIAANCTRLHLIAVVFQTPSIDIRGYPHLTAPNRG